MLQIAILLAILNVVLSMVYFACRNVNSTKKDIAFLFVAVLSCVSIYTGLCFTLVAAALILRNLGDYHSDLQRTKKEEHDMYFHN